LRLHITDALRMDDSHCRCVDGLAVRLRTNAPENFPDNGVCSSRVPAALMNMEGSDRPERVMPRVKQDESSASIWMRVLALRQRWRA
jgi:hypothetical protein